MTDNRIPRFFLKTIWEITMVVLGILIALQVNNWNEDRKLEQKNTDNLSSLTQELNANQQVLRMNIGRVKEMMRIGMILIDSLHDNLVPDARKDKFLVDMIGNLGPLRFRPLTVTSLEEIINSGSYSSILSLDVKDKMLAYSSRLEEVNMTMNRFDESFKSVELPYLTKNLSIVDMLTNRSDRINQADRFMLGEGLPDFQREGYYFKSEHTAFFNNREFTSMLTNRYFDIRAVLKTMLLLDESVNELLACIKEDQD